MGHVIDEVISWGIGRTQAAKMVRESFEQLQSGFAAAGTEVPEDDGRVVSWARRRLDTIVDPLPVPVVPLHRRATTAAAVGVCGKVTQSGAACKNPVKPSGTCAAGH